MSRIVRRHPDFEADFLRLLDGLVARGAEGWVRTLAEGVAECSRLLGRFPAAGTCLERRGNVALRKLILPRGPYVAWYACDESEPAGDLWLVRIFHARQQRPPARVTRWLSAASARPPKRRKSPS